MTFTQILSYLLIIYAVWYIGNILYDIVIDNIRQQHLDSDEAEIDISDMMGDFSAVPVTREKKTKDSGGGQKKNRTITQLCGMKADAFMELVNKQLEQPEDDFFNKVGLAFA